ncbi:MAG: hypothetical protein LBL21_05150 [Rickettsiales bacterium]|jgi:hypothetical protein|nr:hypothetical protein [Rickettsiales bacterium]
MKKIKKYILTMAAVFLTMVASSDLSAAKVCAPTANTVEAMYPVGAIYLSTSSTNPATLFGFGTWERFGQGRALVGVNESETEFSSASKTGGAKTHTLTIAEMPSHNHGSGFQTGNFPNGLGGISSTTAATYFGTFPYQGSGGAHNNLQPYIAVYIWRRVS